MKKIRITYLFLVVAALVVHIAVNSVYTLIFLGVLIIVLAVDCIIYGIIPIKPEIEINAPDTIEKNKDNIIIFKIKNKLFIPLPFVNCKFEIKNNSTGEKSLLSLSFSEPPFGETSHEISLTSAFCGGITFRTVDIKVSDYLGFVSRKISCECSADIIVYPNMEPVKFEFKPDFSNVFESSSYYPDKAGYDISEPIGFRDYEPGDQLKSIHWKLSQKTDGLMIREGGMPKPESITIVYETGIEPNIDTVLFELWDTALEALSSISCELNELGLEHNVIWHDNIIDNQYVMSVKDSDDTGVMLSKLMMSEIALNEIDGISYCRLYNTEHLNGKVIYITTREKISAENIKIICAVNEPKESTKNCIYISPENYVEALSESGI